MPVRAVHGAEARALAGAVGVAQQRRESRVGGRDPAVVDLVPVHRHVPGGGALGPADRLARLEGDLDGQQPEAGYGAPAALHRVVDRPAQHLEAAADAEQRPSGGGVRPDRVGQAGLPQPGQVGDCRLGAGEHHQVGGGQFGRLDGEADPHTRLGREGLHVGGVADPRQPDHCDVEPVGAPGRGRAAEHPPVRERVLRVEPQVQRPRHHPVRRAAGDPAQHVQPRLEQAAIAPELVHHEPGQQRLIGRVEQGDGAEHRGEHAAPVDVADHDRGQPGLPRQAHVDVVAVAQVDLGGAARALADHHVVLGPQLGQRRVRRGGEPGPHLVVVAGGDRVDRLAGQHHLARVVAARLEQYRIETQVGFEPAGGGLHRLGAAQFAAAPVRADHHGGVVRHVLRLERRDPDAPAAQPAADAGGEHALAGVGGGAGDQQPAAHRPLPRRAARVRTPNAARPVAPTRRPTVTG